MMDQGGLSAGEEEVARGSIVLPHLEVLVGWDTGSTGRGSGGEQRQVALSTLGLGGRFLRSGQSEE